MKTNFKVDIAVGFLHICETSEFLCTCLVPACLYRCRVYAFNYTIMVFLSPCLIIVVSYSQQSCFYICIQQKSCMTEKPQHHCVHPEEPSPYICTRQLRFVIIVNHLSSSIYACSSIPVYKHNITAAALLLVCTTITLPHGHTSVTLLYACAGEVSLHVCAAGEFLHKYRVVASPHVCHGLVLVLCAAPVRYV